MSIPISQQVDLLYKKLFGVSKTDMPENKSPSNESIASPALNRGDTAWTQADQIPGIAAATSGVVQAYTGTFAIECTPDITSVPISGVNQTWLTNLTNWISSEFGATYFVQAWADVSGAANPTVTGTQLFADGSSGAGEWFFDYQAGLLNFIGETIPAALTASKVVYIVGYRYIGLTGVTNLPSGTIIGPIQFNGTSIDAINTLEPINIQTFDGANSALYSWTFDSTGNLVLPTNTSSINYANGDPYGGGGGGSYGNANVANYLPTYTGNLDNVDTITTVGNVTVGTGAFFIGDGGLLSNVASSYGDSNVAAYLPTYTGNLDNVDTITANVISSNATIIANSVTLGTTLTPVSVSRWVQLTTASAVPVVLMTISATDVTHVDFNVVATDATSTSRQVSKLMAINYNSTVDYNEYGSLLIGTTVGDFTVTTDGTDIFLNVIAAVTDSVDYNVVAMIYY